MVASPPKKSGRSVLGRILRTLFWAILFAFLFGFLVGTLLRNELDEPIRYIGARGIDAHGLGALASEGSAPATRPGNVRHALSRVLVPSDHEEQVG